MVDTVLLSVCRVDPAQYPFLPKPRPAFLRSANLVKNSV